MHITRGRAFALMDLAASIVVAGVLMCLVIAVLGETRRQSQLDESISNLQRFGAATQSFAADHDGRLWGYTWQPGEIVTWVNVFGDEEKIQLPDNATQAAAHQATHLIRTLGDRVGAEGIAVPNGWLPTVFYSHLPLLEYLQADPLERWTVDPGDRNRVNWKDDPTSKFDEGLWLPHQPEPTHDNKRWPYSSSYMAVPAAWDANGSNLREDAPRVSHGNTHNSYNTNGATFFPSMLADVFYPAQKVHMHDRHQWHFGARTPFYGVNTQEARLPLLAFDGSVSVRQTADANPGWSPHNIEFHCAVFWYQPSDWEPGTMSGEPNDFSKGFYFWTRGGLKGLDFGGRPLDTGQNTPGECDL